MVKKRPAYIIDLLKKHTTTSVSTYAVLTQHSPYIFKHLLFILQSLLHILVHFI